MSVIDAIRAGAVLCYGGTVNGRAEWWLEPDGARVSPIDAARARSALNLHPQADDPIEGQTSQTWRYVNAEISVQQGVAEANQGAPEGAGTAPA